MTKLKNLPMSPAVPHTGCAAKMMEISQALKHAHACRGLGRAFVVKIVPAKKGGKKTLFWNPSLTFCKRMCKLACTHRPGFYYPRDGVLYSYQGGSI